MSHRLALVVGILWVLVSQVPVHATGDHCEPGVLPARQFPAGSDPYAITLADFNGDGVQDVATIHGSAQDCAMDPTVAVLLGDGQAGYGSPMHYQAGFRPTDIAHGDVNGDGKTDLLVCLLADEQCGTSGVAVLLGRGDGTFVASPPVSVGNVPLRIHAPDLNRDGNADVVLLDVEGETGATGGVHVLFGARDGRLSSPVYYDALPFPIHIDVGDLNEDGFDDILVANKDDPYSSRAGDAEIRVLLGREDGSLVPTDPLAVPPYVQHFRLADVDSDGHLDLLAAHGVGPFGVTIIRGLGDGSFDTTMPLVVPSDSVNQVESIDMNGDGTKDLVLLAHECQIDANTYCVAIVLADGLGGFHDPQGYFASMDCARFAITDLNQDGHSDVLASGGVSVTPLLGIGDGSLSTVEYLFADVYTSGMIVADFNGDLQTDIMVGNSNDYLVRLFKSEGERAFASPDLYHVFQTTRSIASSDFDHDGDVDPVIASDSTNGTVRVLRNTGGLFAPLQSSAVGKTPDSLVVADFNLDGEIDIAVTNRIENVISVLPGDGTASFGPRVVYPAGDRPLGLAGGDLNGDRLVDLVAANFAMSPSTASSITVYLNTGKGLFEVAATYQISPFGGHYTRPTLFDIDADGDLDCLVPYNSYLQGSPNGLTLFMNRGDATFEAQALFTLPSFSSPQAVTTIDLDEDSITDILLDSKGALLLFRGAGGGRFEEPVSYAAGGGLIHGGVIDMDNDGQLDVAAVSGRGV